MQTETGQQSFFNLFDQSPATATATNSQPSATVRAEPKVLTFVTERQLEVMRTNPYASFLRDKSLDEMRELDNTIGTDLYKKSHTADGARRLDLWRTAYSSAQTIAIEKEYRSVDARFCSPENGVLYLRGKNGKETAVGYKYNPFYFDRTGERTSFPVHHLEFNSNKIPTDISETGYRSHFFTNIPIAFVKDFADFMVQTLRIALKVKTTIIFDGQEFEFDASMLPAEKPKKKKVNNCPDCGTRLKDDECENCGFFDGDDDEEDFEDFDDE